MKKRPRTPSRKNFDWWGGCAAEESHLLEKGKELFRNFFRVLSVLFNGALLEKGFRFLSSLETKSPRNIPGGFSCVLRMSGSGFLKGFILRGGPATADGAFPLGEKAEGGHCGTSPASPLLRVPFYLSGGAAGRLVFEEGWSSGREGELDLPQKDLPPRFHTHSPALLGGFAFHERFRNGGFTLNRQSRRKALSVEMPDPQGAGGADEASGAQIGAEIPGLAAIPSHEHGRHHRRQARSEDARELIDERNGGIADGGSKLSERGSTWSRTRRRTHDTERQGQSEADIKIVVGIVMEHPEGRNRGCRAAGRRSRTRGPCRYGRRHSPRRG